jgi:hypothetical protein
MFDRFNKEKLMKKLIKRLGALSVLFPILFALSAGVTVRGQRKPDESRSKRPTEAVEQKPTTEQVRAHFQQRMEERLKKDSKLKTGWQTVQVTPNGTNVYAFVRNGQVVDSAFGNAKLSEILRLRFPDGLHRAPRGPKVLAQDDNDGPTEEECLRRSLLCLLQGPDNLWEAAKQIRHVLTVDLDAIDSDLDKAQTKFEKCLGEACKKVLGID